MRLFIGIDIPSEVEEKVKNAFFYTRDVLDFSRFTDFKNLHITIAFLGKTYQKSLFVIKKSIEKVTNLYPPKDLQIDKIVIGPNDQDPRMLWLKFDLDSENYLEKLSDDLKKVLKTEKIKFDNSHQKLEPHITIARFDKKWQQEFTTQNIKRKKEKLDLIKNALPENFNASFNSKSLILYSSFKTTQNQRIYKPLFESNFKG